MTMEIYLNRKKIKLSPQKAIGKGGEADVFDLGKGIAVKIFKTPDHPDYQGFPHEQKAAAYRIQEHQLKLPQFPHNLPQNVITPQQLATDQTGNKILGYTMTFLQGGIPLLKYSDRNFRTSNNITQQNITNIFQQIHQTLSQIHQQQIVIGDLNDLNILINQNQPYFIDADSFQYSNFICRVFTSRFVDPLLCDPQANQPILIKHHNHDSDWYAFNVILMQCLLFVDPYGGIYKPKDKTNLIPHAARPLKRITVFNSEVKYPKPALPYHILSDDLLDHFQKCFTQDKRGIFPQQLIHNLHWQKCNLCGIEYARLSCPNCTIAIPIVKPIPTVIVKGKVTVKPIFATEGVILALQLHNNQLNYLYYENNQFKRENNQLIFQGKLTTGMYFWLNNQATLVGQNGQVISFNSNGIERLSVDSYHEKPVLNCNQYGRYWLQNGQLVKDGKLGSEYIGDVLSDQTQFWLGDQFGFGFYRAGNLNVAFLFDAVTKGINDNIISPKIQGQIIDNTCYFSHKYCWFLISSQNQGEIINQVYVFDKNGTIIAQMEAKQSDNTWLNNIQGHCAFEHFLLVATDEGIIRIAINQNQLIQDKIFTDTEPFVNQNCRLFASNQGLYIVNQQEIKLLQI
jgi:serine/threonine protein kinase